MDLKITLASNSPRRRQLLGWLGIDFVSRPADIDESALPGELPRPYVLRLAESKARAAAHNPSCDRLVLAADTIVADGNALLGKPDGENGARGMLNALRGRTHQVHTALALLEPPDGRLLTELCSTNVPMRAYTDAEMEAYIASGDPLDKAGAYAIQSVEFHPVEQFSGCYASVMGLPMCHLLRALRRWGAAPDVDVAQICRENLHYHCPISEAVLRGEAIG
ncbi:MAF protein [Longilinea arvoryzae]|uniref:dTTP/UTP pyrophosphatase n=1 Tax=Longilinea arvoryzae TaxID=360412 RepID=A0A0S7BAW0_9CHLR|nr:Maf family protein [Longilinea arvoryzae]GAP12301.1 MAF protein [Longilinea arvoryzae]